MGVVIFITYNALNKKRLKNENDYLFNVINMTKKQFFASKWKPFEVMNVFVKELDRACECYLVGVDFEDRIMKLRPIDLEIYEDRIFDVPIELTTRGGDKTKLRVL